VKPLQQIAIIFLSTKSQNRERGGNEKGTDLFSVYSFAPVGGINKDFKIDVFVEFLKFVS
jgi:hypothetical protein